MIAASQTNQVLSQEEGQPPVFPLFAACVKLTAFVICALVISITIIYLIGAQDQLAYTTVCGIACGVSAIIALMPVWQLSRRSTQGAALGFLGGILIRMAICGTVLFVAGRMEGMNKAVLSLWMGGWYMLVLMAEVYLVGRFINNSPAIDLTAKPAGEMNSDADAESKA